MLFNSKPYIETVDRDIGGPRTVGVRTKFDSVTALDDRCYVVNGYVGGGG
ncbi:hypothetical protein RR42_s3088 [Cupriavidus basilensis]|uniref:Uncharacterized protein n=1 Tax=Cupriavidus basilensis TaxID=68895 RepID=A0A0C4YRY5_9BURK|nr:hypothetical protein RR42_s3088 [Cupriavidus basilensis]